MSRRLVLLVALLLAGCTLNSHGPWLTADGVRLENSLVLEYGGSRACDQHTVTFIVFFGEQYARDPSGVLGRLDSVDGAGRQLTYDTLDDLPEGAEATGITHESKGVRREIWLVPDQRDDYIYMASNDQRIERWPRAEVRCGQ